MIITNKFFDSVGIVRMKKYWIIACLSVQTCCIGNHTFADGCNFPSLPVAAVFVAVKKTRKFREWVDLSSITEFKGNDDFYEVPPPPDVWPPHETKTN